MARSTTTRKPANADRERMDTDYAQQAPENRATADDPTGADRNADIVLGAAVIAMGLLAGLIYAIHIPLNDDLVKAGDPARIENLAAVHDDFATPWVAWNIVRTLASTAAFGSLAWALVLRGRMGRAEQPQRTDGYVRG